MAGPQSSKLMTPVRCRSSAPYRSHLRTRARRYERRQGSSSLSGSTITHGKPTGSAHVCKTCRSGFNSHLVLQVWARSSVGRATGLHPVYGGSIPLVSTIRSRRRTAGAGLRSRQRWFESSRDHHHRRVKGRRDDAPRRVGVTASPKGPGCSFEFSAGSAGDRRARLLSESTRVRVPLGGP